MSESGVDNKPSNANGSTSDDTSKTISPAARKFAEYLARRMRPMIEHAAKGDTAESVDSERSDVARQTKH
jgi:hypothetical protein